MARKVALAWIENDAARRATMRKRRMGLMKKVRELSTLCGVEACAVVLAPVEGRAPEVWPSETEARATLLKCKALSEQQNGKKSLDPAGFMDQEIAKLEHQIRKRRAENWELGLRDLLGEALAGKRGLTDLERAEDSVALDRIIGEMMTGVQQRIWAMKAAATAASNVHSSCAYPNPSPSPSDGMGLGGWDVVGAMKASALNPSTNNIVPNPNPTPCGGTELGFAGAIKTSAASTPSTSIVPDLNLSPSPSPSPSPSGGANYGLLNGGDYHPGFLGLEEVMIQGSPSWTLDLSIFKDCPYL